VPPTPHPLPWASGWFDMVTKWLFSDIMTRSKTPSWVRKGRQITEENSQNSVTREELEHLFAYELRVANADVLKLKVYDRQERYTPKSDLPEMKR